MANGSRHSMAYVAEASYGVTPATPAFKSLRHTSTSLALSKETLESEELRQDRQVADVRHGAFQVGGDMGIELSYGAYDDLLQAALGGTWSTVKDSTVTSLSAASGSFTRATGSFVTDGFAVGDVVTASGFATAGNNGRFLVTAVVALTLTVTPLQGQTMGADVSAAGRQVIARAGVKTGQTRRSFTVERNFADIAGVDKPYHRFTGVEVNGLELQIAANAMVKGSFTFFGQGMATATTAIAGSTYTASAANSPLDSFTGALVEGGVAIAVITEMQLNLENGLEPRFVVGSKQSLQASIGRSKVSGTVTAYFENSLLLDKFINETESSLEFSLPDAQGNAYRIFLPRIKYTGGQPDVSGEGPVTLSMPFVALLHAASAMTMLIER